MRRLIASLSLALLVSFAAQAAGPPNVSEKFTMGTPRTLADLRKLEERVQWVMRKAIPSVVGFGGGSAVIVSKDGLALTVAHVGGKAGRDVTFLFPDGKKARGKTLGNYRGVDAGMARITDKGDWPFSPMGRSASLKPGQWVITMGFPVSFSKGTRPPVRVGRILRVTATAIVTDCPMMGGDSGGPVFDMDGNVIGQNSRTEGRGVTGNVHVPVDIFHTHWKKMMAGEDWGTAKGKGTALAMQPDTPPKKGRPRSGANGRMNGAKEAFREATEPSGGCVVRVLCDGKPAALGTVVSADGLIVTKASLLAGAITCRLADGRTLEAEKAGEDKGSDLAVLRVAAKGLKPALWREGVPAPGNLISAVGEKGEPLAIGTVTSEPRTFRVSEKGGKARPVLGIGIEEGNGGVKVTRVDGGGAAARAGLREGDLLKALGESAVKDLRQVRAAMGKLKAGENVAVTLERNGKEQKVTAKLGLAAPPYDRWGGGPFSERRFGFGAVLPTDAAVLPGDCGGPVVDTSGRVAGVIVSRALRISTYVLPAADVKRIVARIKAGE